MAFENESGAGLERLVDQAGRTAVLDNTPLSTSFGELMAERLRSETTTREQRMAFAGVASEQLGMTQREIASILGVSHPPVGKLAADWHKATGLKGSRARLKGASPKKTKTTKGGGS